MDGCRTEVRHRGVSVKSLWNLQLYCHRLEWYVYRKKEKTELGGDVKVERSESNPKSEI